MYGIQTINRAYFFEKLENYENNEPVKIEGNPDITIEHIFPQNPDPKWKVELKEEQFNLLKEKYLNTVGNLTLSGNNGKLSNKYFTDKRDLNIDDKEQGYRFSRLWLNKHLSTLDKWDAEEIEKRFELIAERFLKIWKFPAISLIEATNETEEVNIFDAEDPTYKKLEYAIFFNQKLNIKTISDLYATVMISLFELNPEAFFTEEIERKLTLTKHDKDCRETIELNDTYYIEKHMSSKDKFDRLKILLNAMSLEDELLIKYSAE